MDLIDNAIPRISEYSKLYSSRSIWIGTFLGGPLAAGYLIGENYKALNEPENGRTALITGIGLSIALFVALFTLPENVVDGLPGQAVPLLYTFAAWGLVEWKQGEALLEHKEVGRPFFSAWRAAGVGLISLVILMAGLASYVFYGFDGEVYDRYDEEMSQYYQNETETMGFYDHLDDKSTQYLSRELEKQIIPKWEENINIVEGTNGIENLPAELAEQNKLLLEYANLRLETFRLFKSAIDEGTDVYDSRLEHLHMKIESVLKKME